MQPFSRRFRMRSQALGFTIVPLLIAAIVISDGCGASRAIKGSAIGAGAGGVIGAIIGKQSGNTATGAIVGAAVGGTAGGLIGRHMDKEAAELKAVEGAKVERVGEGIQVTMESGILFETNQYALQSQAQKNIQKMATVLNKYPDTNLLIAGHTDSDGTDQYNQTLSENRAKAVANYLVSLGVSSPRLTTVGFGEKQPVQSNDTAAGKQANRRVEIAIVANETMIQEAKAGTLK
jgi:outer membrane protein OmpA-like peptidoglycan-associated protein